MKNYIFDLYGTLVDIKTDENKAAVWNKTAVYFSMHGAGYTGKELKRRYEELCRLEGEALYRKLKKQYPELKKGQEEIDLARVFKRLYLEKGVKADKRKIAETMMTFRTITMKKLRLFAGAEELLAALKEAGKGVYLLSNAQTNFTAPEMELLGLTGYFDDILFSSDYKMKKPSMYFYEILFEKHGLKKEESVMIGNDRFADAGGAEDFGIASIYLQTEQSTPFEGGLPKHCKQAENLWEILKNIDE
ncbi:MAG: HAD family hydrolase [Lachnospiraceae bacterium]|nr:HAD family hydrolase [Lachnospiraceae bacterium]